LIVVIKTKKQYNAKYLIEKQFNLDYDYKIFAPEASGSKKGMRCGHNKEIIILKIFYY